VQSTPRAGIALADSRYELEANAYLQRRLEIFYGVALAFVAILYAVDTALSVPWEGWTAGLFLRAPRLIHLGAIVGTGLTLFALGRCPLRARALRMLDALGLNILVAAIVLIYALVYEHGPTAAIGLIALFVVMRAVVVPSAALTTLWLSVPAPVAVLAVQLSCGTVYVADGMRVWPEDFGETVVWDQVILWFGVGIAVVASRVNFRLRHQVRAALELGQYHLEERIGEGAMGEVYRARHAMLKRPAAVKLIRPEITDPDTLRRFEREVQETSRLRHPNTISIFDFGRTPDGVFYYAMELLDGPDLRTAVEKTGPMPAARVIHLLRQACGALREAHEAGLVHRDIKPGNFVLCRAGSDLDVVKLVDFGLVKDVRSAAGSSLTAIGEICGTPETLAPEVLQGEAASPAADQYALGVVAYFALTGVPVYDAKSPAEFIGHHLHTPPPPLRERAPDVPEDLAAVVHRCLAKDKGERFADVQALATALEGCGDAGRWTESDAAAWWRAMEGET
jgi:serine/threonine-protein kinase